MLKTKEARRLVYQQLGFVLGPAFVLKKSDERFVRVFAGKQDALSVGFWAYPPQFVFAVAPAVRIDAVEELYREVFDVTDKKTNTVLTQLWRLDGLRQRPEGHVPLPGSDSPYFWTFTDEQSVCQAVTQLKPVLDQHVLPFYQQIRSVADAHAALNIDQLDVSNGRMFHGLVAAYLAARSSWKLLADTYRKELEQWPGSDQQRFEAAVERLEQHASRNEE